MLDRTKKAASDVKLELPSLKKISHVCSEMVTFTLSFTELLKLAYPLEIGGISRNGRVTTELGGGSLGQTLSAFFNPRTSKPS